MSIHTRDAFCCKKYREGLQRRRPKWISDKELEALVVWVTAWEAHWNALAESSVNLRKEEE